MIQDSEMELTRVAFLASRSVGGAVQRNRCKRLLRSRVARFVSDVQRPKNLLLIARKPLLSATAEEIDQCLAMLFEKAKLIQK